MPLTNQIHHLKFFHSCCGFCNSVAMVPAIASRGSFWPPEIANFTFADIVSNFSFFNSNKDNSEGSEPKSYSIFLEYENQLRQCNCTIFFCCLILSIICTTVDHALAHTIHFLPSHICKTRDRL